MAITIAIAYGLQVQDADWMPIAALVAMKTNVQQTTLAAEQRLAGAAIGAIVASVFLLSIDSKGVLSLLIIVLGALAGYTYSANYAYYCAALAAVLLIAIGLPHPTDLASEARRVLFTFVGVGIAVLITLLANLLQMRSPKATPGTSAQG